MKRWLLRLYSWRRKCHRVTPVFLPGESNGQRSLAGHSPWGCKELDVTEHNTLSLTHTHTHTTQATQGCSEVAQAGFHNHLGDKTLATPRMCFQTSLKVSGNK